MNLQHAQSIASALVEQMRPFCRRVEIAGSIRRCKPDGIKDVEVVAIPAWESRTALVGLFQEERLYDVNLLHSWAINDGDLHGIQWIKTGTDEIKSIVPHPDGKYWRGVWPDGVKLDLFLCAPDNWGATLLLRTGSAEFSRGVVTHAARIGRPSIDGRYTIGGVPIETLEEPDVFELLGLRFVEPAFRRGFNDVREETG